MDPVLRCRTRREHYLLQAFFHGIIPRQPIVQLIDIVRFTPLVSESCYARYEPTRKGQKVSELVRFQPVHIPNGFCDGVIPVPDAHQHRVEPVRPVPRRHQPPASFLTDTDDEDDTDAGITKVSGGEKRKVARGSKRKNNHWDARRAKLKRDKKSKSKILTLGFKVWPHFLSFYFWIAEQWNAVDAGHNAKESKGQKDTLRPTNRNDMEKSKSMEILTLG